MQINKNILLVNPWIADFAAYDLWSKPLGLLYVGAFLRQHGYNLSLLDLQNREYWDIDQDEGKYAHTGRGKYHKTILPQPDILENVERHYGLYGAKKEQLHEELSSYPSNSIDAIFVTSQMTYWYPGVQKTIDIIKKYYPDTPIVLGGIYVTLCPDHARSEIDADYYICGPGEIKGLKIADKICDINRDYNKIQPHTNTFPPWDLYQKLDSISIITSRGCPYNCDFCATDTLQPQLHMREPQNVIEEMKYAYNQFKVNDIAFYDDALFYRKDEHIKPLLRKVINLDLDINLHTPNGLFTKEIGQELARLMKKAGFSTVRLSLESSLSKWQDSASNKVNKDDFKKALKYLKQAHYTSKDIETYLIMGLPGQTVKDVKESLEFVYQCGAISRLAAFTPIPNTKEWERAVKLGMIQKDIDPLLTNNTLHPCANEDFPEEEYQNLRDYSNKLNNKIRNQYG